MQGKQQYVGVVVGWPGETVEERVVNYPQRKVQRGLWSPEVAQFTTETLSKVPLLSKNYVREQLWLTGNLAAWWAAKGRPLDVERAFDPYTVTTYVEAGMPGSAGARVTYASILRRLGPRVTTKAPWQRHDNRPRKPSSMAPYSDIELDMLEADARSQSTELARHRFAAFLERSGCGG